MRKRVSVFVAELVVFLFAYFSLAEVALTLLREMIDKFDHYGLAGISLFFGCFAYCYTFRASNVAHFAWLGLVASMFTPVIFLIINNSGFGGIDFLASLKLIGFSLILVGAPITFGKLFAMLCCRWLRTNAELQV